MLPPALLSDVGDHSDWDVGMENCRIHVPVNGFVTRMLPEHMKFLLDPPPLSDDDDDDGCGYGDVDIDYNDDEHSIDSGDQFAAYLLYDRHRWEPLGSYLTRQYYQYSAPPYFKRDHPDDDLFLKQLGDSQVPWTTELKYPKHADDESLIKDIVAFIIWEDTKHDIFWENLHKLSPPDQDDTLYSGIIRAAAFLVYFLHTKANLFKIGHDRILDKQMDKIFTLAEQCSKEGIPVDEVCELLVKLTLDKDEFSLVTENNLAYTLCDYAIDLRFKDFKRPTAKVTFPPTDKDQLFEEITKVVGKVELSSTELEADEYTHWIMTLLREEVSQVEENLVSQAIGDDPMLELKLPRPSVDINPMTTLPQPLSMDDLSAFLLRLMAKAKNRMKQELANVVLPISELCKLHRCKVCNEICETIQVADLRRMSLGSRFIGRSHLIWAFYKLGYALPLGIRNTMIKLSDSDEDHPPYHIYIAALKLTLLSGEKMMLLDHFIYAILNSKHIDFDGKHKQWTEFYQDFKDFQKALESMETEVEPKSTVIVRPCRSLNIFSDSE